MEFNASDRFFWTLIRTPEDAYPVRAILANHDGERQILTYRQRIALWRWCGDFVGDDPEAFTLDGDHFLFSTVEAGAAFALVWNGTPVEIGTLDDVEAFREYY